MKHSVLENVDKLMDMVHMCVVYTNGIYILVYTKCILAIVKPGTLYIYHDLGIE
jgi:hypothetical protein